MPPARLVGGTKVKPLCAWHDVTGHQVILNTHDVATRAIAETWDAAYSAASFSASRAAFIAAARASTSPTMCSTISSVFTVWLVLPMP